MRRYFSFSATREVAEAGTQGPLPPRRMQEVARQSLVNVGGLSYPNLQPASMWTYCEQVDSGVTFTFARARPIGDVRFDQDLSFVATRQPIDDEAATPLIFLEALTWELVCNLVFFHRVITAFGRPGTFRIALGFMGFDNAQVDWAGFWEEPEVEGREGILTNWRFRPPQEAVTYEAPGVTFPLQRDDFIASVSDVVAETAFAVKGLRRTAFDRTESRLTLSRESIMNVVRAALERVAGDKPPAATAKRAVVA